MWKGSGCSGCDGSSDPPECQPTFKVMDTISPAVSPSVVAQIFMTQKAKVMWGSLFMGEMFGDLFRLGVEKIPIHEAGGVYED